MLTTKNVREPCFSSLKNFEQKCWYKFHGITTKLVTWVIGEPPLFHAMTREEVTERWNGFTIPRPFLNLSRIRKSNNINLFCGIPRTLGAFRFLLGSPFGVSRSPRSQQHWLLECKSLCLLWWRIREAKVPATRVITVRRRLWLLKFIDLSPSAFLPPSLYPCFSFAIPFHLFLALRSFLFSRLIPSIQWCTTDYPPPPSRRPMENRELSFLPFVPHTIQWIASNANSDFWLKSLFARCASFGPSGGGLSERAFLKDARVKERERAVRVLVETLDEKQMDVGGTLNYQGAVFLYVVEGIRCRSKYNVEWKI